MKALTIWQPWASLIMADAKPFEFRHWPAPAQLVGQRIVIHAGARKVRADEMAGLIGRLGCGGEGTGLRVAPALDLLETWWRRGHGACLPLAAGLGTAILGKPRLAHEIFTGAVADSERIDRHVWAWPLTEIETWEPVRPARGLQGFWEWPEAVAA